MTVLLKKIHELLGKVLLESLPFAVIFLYSPCYCCCSVTQLCSTLQSHGLQHARSPCPLPSPRFCPRLRSLYQWCHQAISSSDALFSFCPQSFPASETFPMSHLFALDDQNTEASASTSVLPVNIQGLSPLRLTGLISLLSKGLSRVFSSTTVQMHQFSGILLSLRSSSHNCTWPLGRPYSPYIRLKSHSRTFAHWF